MIGDESGAYLHDQSEAAFKREVDADEAVWRTLPFFAAILGLAVAVLPAIYRSLDQVGSGGWHVVALTMFAVAVLCFVIAGFWFWSVIRLREYTYPPGSAELLTYAEQLSAFYAAHGLSPEDGDHAVRNDMRAFMTRQFADTAEGNRANNNAKAAARSQVLLFVMTGFLLAFLSEATILAAQAFGAGTRSSGGGYVGTKAGQAIGRGGRQSAAAAKDAGRPGRRELSAMDPADRQQRQERGISQERRQPRPTQPPERPAPTVPEWLKKNEEVPRPSS
jgi:hypothetical protein